MVSRSRRPSRLYVTTFHSRLLRLRYQYDSQPPLSQARRFSVIAVTPRLDNFRAIGSNYQTRLTLRRSRHGGSDNDNNSEQHDLQSLQYAYCKTLPPKKSSRSCKDDANAAPGVLMKTGNWRLNNLVPPELLLLIFIGVSWPLPLTCGHILHPPPPLTSPPSDLASPSPHNLRLVAVSGFSHDWSPPLPPRARLSHNSRPEPVSSPLSNFANSSIGFPRHVASHTLTGDVRSVPGLSAILPTRRHAVRDFRAHQQQPPAPPSSFSLAILTRANSVSLYP
ncbi:hypothetical protein R3P38DRAFT_3188875 [Favolaschia claudopus]|uniref:Uncharacterized protein n=1 Tax=Favolaschia claudopus TaxID=2862362 RepID=A0AAW0BUQ6_9AGAR